jgi:hypothetical protein
MAEYHFTEITLRGHTFKVYDGFPMRTLRAMTVAGGQPTPEMETEWRDSPLKMTLYAARFVQSYFELLDDFMADAPGSEVMAAFSAIMEATKRDPFGQPLVPPEAAKTPAPTTGS